MRLGEAIDMAETALGRGLNGDEITLVGRMVDAGKDAAEILAMLDVEVVIPDEDDGKTYRFEARGDRVVPINAPGSAEEAKG